MPIITLFQLPKYATLLCSHQLRSFLKLNFVKYILYFKHLSSFITYIFFKEECFKYDELIYSSKQSQTNLYLM